MCPYIQLRRLCVFTILLGGLACSSEEAAGGGDVLVISDVSTDVSGADISDASSGTSPLDATADADVGAPVDATVPPDAASTSQDAAASDATQDAGSVPDATTSGCQPPCTMDQMCEAGVCKDVPKPCGGTCAAGTYCDSGTNLCQASQCTLPTSFSDSVQKVSFLQIATSDQGCDFNGDGSPDNVFGKILKVYADANTELIKSVQSGLFVLLMEAPGYTVGPTSFSIHGYLGELDPSNKDCPVTAAFGQCKYTVDADNFSPGPGNSVCPAQFSISPATVTQGYLTAGGALDQTLTLVLPVVGGLPVKMTAVTLKGQVEGATAWSQTKKGRICGVMTKTDFKAAIDAVPESAWKEINLDKATVESVLEIFLAPDIDLNKDGTPDAISMALDFESVSGSITKVIP